LRQVRDREGLEAARDRLVEALVGYSAYQGFDTRLVFDAQYRDACSTRQVITPNLSVHFTDFMQTADTFIERACADFRQDLRKFHQRLIVATSDRAQQLTVRGYGAEWMSAEQLANEVEVTVKRVQRHLKSNKKPTSRFLVHSLDPEAKERLAKMRFGKLS